MASENETVYDIIAEISTMGEYRVIANRLDAAWKRERESLLTKQGENVNSGSAVYTGENKVGNMAAMREALVIAKKAICNHARANHTCDSLAWENSTINANCGDILCGHRDLCEAKTAIQKAISKPPRNCDVGTAEEQAERFRRHCDKFTRDGMHETCPCCGKIPFAGCEFAWAQMPYAAEEGGAK